MYEERTKFNNSYHYAIWGHSVLTREAFAKERSYLPNSWGRFLETVSDYFPYPAIPPYYLRTLQFVARRLTKRAYFGCSSNRVRSAQTITWTQTQSVSRYHHVLRQVVTRMATRELGSPIRDGPARETRPADAIHDDGVSLTPYTNMMR